MNRAYPQFDVAKVVQKTSICPQIDLTEREISRLRARCQEVIPNLKKVFARVFPSFDVERIQVGGYNRDSDCVRIGDRIALVPFYARECVAIHWDVLAVESRPGHFDPVHGGEPPSEEFATIFENIGEGIYDRLAEFAAAGYAYVDAANAVMDIRLEEEYDPDDIK